MRYKMNFSLIKRGKYWYCRFYNSQGVRVSRSTGQTSKAKATLIAEEWYKDDVFVFTEHTFYQYAKDFFSKDGVWFKDLNIVKANTSESTRTVYENRLKVHLLPYWGKVKLKEITPTKIKEWRLNVLVKAGMSVNSVNYIITVLGIILKQAMADGLIGSNPVKAVSRLKEDKEKKDAFLLEEVKQMLCLSKPQKDIYVMILVGAVTGLRRSEIIGITETSLKDGFLDIIKQRSFKGLAFTPTKTRECRKVIVPFLLINELNNLLKKVEGVSEKICFDKSLFYYHNKVSQIIKQAVNGQDRNVTFHSLRHFFNTYLLSENVSPAKVAGILGHSSGVGAMTDLYTNWKPEHFKEVLEAQEKLLKLLLEDDEKDIKK